jgi:hypothetical protein
MDRLSKIIKKILLEVTSDSSGSRGSYVSPLQVGIRRFNDSQNGPFTIPVSNYDNPMLEYDSYDGSMDSSKKNIKKITKDTISEDLAVWFGKKKKSKGSSQPKGPWVNICSKVDGKHPPCGRQDTSKGSYPKCRAAGVAGKMSDSQKRSACQQKRTAEKKDTQTGKGQKPIMTSYKTKKESVDSLVDKILIEIRNSF